MKTALATVIILGTLASSIVAGALFFSPTSDLTAPAGPDVPGSVTVVVTDDEGDPVEGAQVNIKSNAGAGVGKTATTDATGRALVHLPADGWYSLHTQLPKDYTPRTDIDKEQPGLCQGADHRLCITVELAGSVVTLESDKTPRTELSVEANDTTPEPRIAFETFDSDTNKDLSGGRLVITRESDRKVVWNEDHKSAKEITHQLASGTYTVTWVPPSTHHHHNGTHTQTLTVPAKRTVRMGAHPVKTTAGPTPTPGIQLPTRSVADVKVVDADTGAGVDAGSVRVTFTAPNGKSLRITYPTKGGVANVSLLTGFDIDYVAPAGYTVVGAAWAKVADGSQAAIQFTVKKQAQKRAAEEPIGEPEENEETGGDQVSAGDGIIPIPVEEAPTPEPVETNDDDRGDDDDEEEDEDVSVEPSQAELEADCYMYLEMYPELVELDPYLPTYCGQNPADAQRIISELLSESDK